MKTRRTTTARRRRPRKESFPLNGTMMRFDDKSEEQERKGSKDQNLAITNFTSVFFLEKINLKEEKKKKIYIAFTLFATTTIP